MFSVRYACWICINFNKYLTDLLAIRCIIVKRGAFILYICIYIYIVIIIVVLGFGYPRLALNINHCK